MKTSNTYLTHLHRQADRMLASVVALLALASIALAPWYHTWSEALFIAGPTVAVIGWLTLTQSGALVTRCAIAAALMVLTGLHIQQAHGVIEAHFGVFVLLSFLLIYRDWVPLVVAAAVIAVHHIAFYLMQHAGTQVWVFPNDRGFGIVMVHAAYVVFETALLVYMAIRLKAEITAVGAEPAALARMSQELARGNVEVEVPTAGAVPGSLASAMAEMRLALAQAVTGTGDVLRSVAGGDLSRRVSIEASGEFERLKENVNRTVDFLATFSAGQQELVRRANRGDFGGRCDTGGLQGFQLEMAAGLNQLAGSVETFIADFAVAQSAIAAGDLSRPIDRAFAGHLEELRRDTNRTMQQLAGIVGRIRDAADAIGVASERIAHGHADLTQRSGEQAGALRQAADSVGNLATEVQENARSATTASQLSLAASEAAARGGAAVRAVVGTMQGISSASTRISEITGVIQEIAFQTNLLALNAAVEAARAGERGHGFAVVASEVQALASRAATAADEIKDLISDSVRRIDDGAEQAGRTGEMVQEIVTSIDAVTRIIGELAIASRQQSSGIGTVSASIAQLAAGTDQSLSIMRASASMAENMAVEARALRESVRVFKLT